MILTIHTYGHIDAMFYILNGIAMIMNSPFADMMIKAVSMVATCYYGFKIAYASSSGNARPNLAKIGSMIIVINALLIPKTTMFIEDHVTKQRDHVDNLPYGFAIPVGFMEGFGNILTASFEQAFTAVASSNYRDYGMVFGARLVQEARNWRIKTPEFVHNMDNFIRRCVVMDAAIGRKYTINDLFNSDDVWKLVSTKASQLRRVDMRVGMNHELLTCKEAVDTVLNPEFVLELEKLNIVYKKTDFGLAGNLGEMLTPRGVLGHNDFFKRNIKTVFGNYLGNGNTAEANLRQYMMLNSMSDYSSTYGYARASMSQDTNWRIAGDLASVYLPILLSVIKGLVYASFIFMVPLMLLGGGGQKYMSYIAVVASLQLWPALNSILNMFIDLYSADQLKNMAMGAVSYTSYSSVGNYSDKIVAVASGLQMMIPFLSFNIVQGGVGGFIHLASNITGASSSAASAAAQEVTTGNKSFDNYSSGNMQIAMNQGFKTDWNQSYKAGGRDLQKEDGSIQRVLPNGKDISISGPGLTESQGTNRIMLNDETSNQLHESHSDNLTFRKGLEMRRSDSQKSLNNMLTQYAINVNTHTGAQKDNNFNIIGNDDEGAREMRGSGKNLNSNFDYANRQSNASNVSAAGSMGLDGSIGSGKIRQLGGVSGNINASIGGKAEFTVDNTNTQSWNEQNTDAKNLDWHRDRNILHEAAQNEGFNKGDAINKDLLDNISHTQDEIRGYDRDIQRSFAKEEQLQRQIAHTSTINSGSNIDITPEVKKQLVENFGKNSQEADYLINNQASLTGPDRRILDQAKKNVVSHYMRNSDPKMGAIEDNIQDRREQLPEDVKKEMRHFKHESIQEVNEHIITGKGRIIAKADNEGVNKQDIQERIDIAEHATQYHHKELVERALEAADDAKRQNTASMDNNQKIIDERDEKRWFGEKKNK
jgi:hypothetical protein